ncbi:hypothetical protein GW17_00052215 [Ensete ventricosum]|nr:hypothetical protein GW17_00052215 [Ensete ventricosum]
MRFGGARSSFPFIWRKISVHVELKGVVGGHVQLKSDPSTLLLVGFEVGPLDCSALGCFYSSHFSTIRVSIAMKWFALYIISNTVSEQPEVGRYRLVSYLESEGDIADWSACRIQPATLPAACWQGCHRLVDPLHLLCPTIGQLPARVLPCYQSSIVNVIERPLELVRTSTLVVGFAETESTSVVHLT